MGTQEQMIAIYTKLHENREEHIFQARRARDMQEDLVNTKAELEKLREEYEYLKNRAPIV